MRLRHWPYAVRDVELDPETGRGRTVRNPAPASADAPIAEAVETLVDRRIGGLPVVRDGLLVGVFTEKDALRGYLDLLRAVEGTSPGG